MYTIDEIGQAWSYRLLSMKNLFSRNTLYIEHWRYIFQLLGNTRTREGTFRVFPMFVPSKENVWRDWGFVEINREMSRFLNFFRPGVEPLDLNVSSVPRTMVLAQGSQGSKGLLLPVYPRSQLFVRSLLCAGGIHLTGCVGWKRDAYFLSSPDPANKKILAST